MEAEERSLSLPRGVQLDESLYCAEDDDTSHPAAERARPRPGPATATHGAAASPSQPPRSRKRRSAVTICLAACRYESVRSAASAFGMREVSDAEEWDFCWTDVSVSVERAKDMKRFQRINHFPGMLEICRKDLLARNLNRMQKIYPNEYNFFPKTWCLPADFGEALGYSKSRRNKTFIVKPECGSQGRGIYLTRTLKDIKPTDRLICQVYLSRPFLVDGYKFDMRVYALITSCDPLRVFVYNEGLVRFATTRYAEPSLTNTTNVFMHLTNYAVNKHSRTYVHDDQAGSKRKISTLNKILASQGVDVEKLWHAVDQVIVKTIISAWPILKHSYRACFPSHDTVHACFEVLGFDILLDHKLHPYILEVNHSPSFHTDTALDREVKGSLLTDTFTILNVRQGDRRRVCEEDRRRVRDRLLQLPGRVAEPAVESEKSPWQTQIEWEETHLGNFRRVYPMAAQQYAALFQQPTGSLYTGTASSRARGDCTRVQRDDFQQAKAKAEALKATVLPRAARSKTACEEAPTQQDKERPGRARRERPREVKTKLAESEATASEVASPSRCSYEPGRIVEKEERERSGLLAQRDFLVRSYGLLELIYTVMKKSGTLRPEDERKYGVYGRLADKRL